jgi:competence protein ComEA
MLKNIFLGWVLSVFMLSFVSANPSTDAVPPPDLAKSQVPVEEVEKVNINTADAATLEAKLAGIGEKKAQAIVEFREKNGPFKVPADIMQVQGIGEKIFEMNKDKIVTDLPAEVVKEEPQSEKTEPAPTEAATPPTTEAEPAVNKESAEPPAESQDSAKDSGNDTK